MLYLIDSLEIGGTERQLVALARCLSDRNRFAPAVICLNGLGSLASELMAAGVPVFGVRLRGRNPITDPLGVVRELLSLFRIVRREQPAIVHGLLFRAYVLGAIVARLCGTPVFVSSRRSLGRFKERRRAARLLERLTNRYANVIIANSEAVRRDTIRQERVAPEKVIVVHNGLEYRDVEAARGEELRRSLRIGRDDHVIGVVANFIHYKGHDVFLEAWRTIVTAAPHTIAVLVGDGPTKRDIEQRAVRMRLDTSLRFVGTRTDVPDLLGLMDVVVQPSLEEGFSNAVLEAMGAGRAIVVTAVGGNTEAVTDEETGLLVPPGDAAALAAAVVRLLNDPAARHTLGLAAKRRVTSDFALDRMVQRYEALYLQLVKDSA